MKIGIFGDSYVEKWNPSHRLARQCLPDDIANLFCNDNQPIPWYSFLQIYNNTYEVFEHGCGGCDNWYIYNTFLDNHEKYENVIIVWTNDARYSWTTHEEGYEAYPEEEQKRHWLHVSNIGTAINKSEHYGAEIKKPPIKGIPRYREDYKTMIDFLGRIHYADRRRHNTFSKLLRKEIQQIRPDAIFINAFNPTEDKEDHNNTLHEITLYESKSMHGKTEDVDHALIPTFYDGTPPMDALIDCRVCHLTRTSHKKLARMVMNAIDYKHTSVPIIINDFYREMEKQDYREFWTRRDMLKYANIYYNAGISIG